MIQKSMIQKKYEPEQYDTEKYDTEKYDTVNPNIIRNDLTCCNLLQSAIIECSITYNNSTSFTEKCYIV